MISLKTGPVVFIILILLLLAAAYVVFRLIVRRDYLLQGYLTWYSSALQLLVFAGLMCFPYLFLPPVWPWFWTLDGPTSHQQQVIGLIVIVSGFVIAFGTMGWFGIQRAFGLRTQGLICTGPYRLTRNPQVLGGYLLVIGTSLQWPSWYALVWIALYGISVHWMIISEEEHLQAIFGSDHESYCLRTPRYLLKRKKS